MGHPSMFRCWLVLVLVLVAPAGRAASVPSVQTGVNVSSAPKDPNACGRSSRPAAGNELTKKKLHLKPAHAH
jgi:hypothetical protein